MPRLPARKPKDIVRLLEQSDFVFKRSRGSHHIYIRRRDNKMVVVPMHAHDLPKGTLADILKQAGIRRDQL